MAVLYGCTCPISGFVLLVASDAILLVECRADGRSPTDEELDGLTPTTSLTRVDIGDILTKSSISNSADMSP